MPQRTTPPALLVLTTLPERAAAEALARELLAARLAACIHVGAPVRSLYHWRGQIETADETPLAIKTRAELSADVHAGEARLLAHKLKAMVGISAQIEVVESGRLKRSTGKASRVTDRR